MSQRFAWSFVFLQVGPSQKNCSLFAMISPTCLQILGDSERVPNNVLRFFVRLMATYDLSRFKILHMQRLMETFAMNSDTIAECIATLVAVGILEEGPLAKIRGRQRLLSTYRIRPRMMVSPEEMKDWFREAREREEREALVPAVPLGPVSVVT
jgi:hypothetical protein